MNLKVWSNLKKPIRLFETGRNYITTDFCTDERRRKCVALGICQAEEPQCTSDDCKMAKVNYVSYVHTIAHGSVSQHIKLREKISTGVKAALATRLESCKPYYLCWHRWREARLRKNMRPSRKKRCRPSKK